MTSHANRAGAASARPSNDDTAPRLTEAARLLLAHLEHGRRVDAAMLRAAMEQAFGASDNSGAWTWKMGYDACEAAAVMFLRKYGKAILRKAGSPGVALPTLAKIANLLPTHTRRSEESQTFQQFSTPLPLGLAALTAAAIVPGDRVLEPVACFPEVRPRMSFESGYFQSLEWRRGHGTKGTNDRGDHRGLA